MSHFNVIIIISVQLGITQEKFALFCAEFAVPPRAEPVGRLANGTGNAVLLSEEDYNRLMETLHLSSIPAVREAIVKGLHPPLSECLREDEVDW